MTFSGIKVHMNNSSRFRALTHIIGYMDIKTAPPVYLLMMALCCADPLLQD